MHKRIKLGLGKQLNSGELEFAILVMFFHSFCADFWSCKWKQQRSHDLSSHQCPHGSPAELGYADLPQADLCREASRPGSQQLYGWFWEGQHKLWKGSDTSAGGFPQLMCQKQRNGCSQTSQLYARFGVEFVPPLLSSCLRPFPDLISDFWLASLPSKSSPCSPWPLL